jgi:hypothetical protein
LVANGSRNGHDPDEEGPVPDRPVDEEEEAVLDESSDEGLKQGKKRAKKSGNRQLRTDVLSAQGKSMSADGINSKRKLTQNQEAW